MASVAATVRIAIALSAVIVVATVSKSTVPTPTTDSVSFVRGGACNRVAFVT